MNKILINIGRILGLLFFLSVIGFVLYWTFYQYGLCIEEGMSKMYCIRHAGWL